MRTSPAVIAEKLIVETVDESGDEVVRSLTGLIEILGRGRSTTDSAENASEEVLVDREVGGARYVLVRMRLLRNSRLQLSPREHEIVRMVAKGHPNKVIADVLNISSWTVCTHLRRIFAKLGVGSRAAMVAQLLELGVLASEHRIRSEPR